MHVRADEDLRGGLHLRVHGPARANISIRFTNRLILSKTANSYDRFPKQAVPRRSERAVVERLAHAASLRADPPRGRRRLVRFVIRVRLHGTFSFEQIVFGEVVGVAAVRPVPLALGS